MSDTEGRKVSRTRYFPDSRLRKDATGAGEIRSYCRSQHSKDSGSGVLFRVSGFRCQMSKGVREIRIYSEVVP
jgi:hypothetical protein